MISDYFGLNTSLAGIRNQCQITKGGISLATLHDVANSLGFDAIGVSLSWDELLYKAPLPCIVHWNGTHFVVVYEIIKKRRDYQISVADPAIGLLKYNEKAFSACWINGAIPKQGVALLIEPSENLSRQTLGSQPSSLLQRLIPLMKPFRIPLSGVFLSLLLSTILSVGLPFFTQSIVDRGIGQKKLSLVAIFLAGQLAIVVGMATNQLIRNRLSFKISFRVGIILVKGFLSKLMALPIPFFENRRVGDLLQRVSDCSRIQNFITSTFISFLFAVLSLVIYGIAMGAYQLKVLIIFFIGAGAYIVWILLFMKRRRELDYIRFQESSIQQSNIVEIISGMSEIKLNNCREKMKNRWVDGQKQLMEVNLKNLNLAQVQEIGGLFIDQTKNILITYLAARSVIDGQMTIGMMMSIQYIVGQLNAPLHQLLFFIQNSQDAKISLERLEDLYHLDNEEDAQHTYLTHIPHNAGIILSNVCFSYPGNRKKAIDSLSLAIPYGSVTAIVGASGCGKTTLIKILMGSYRPTEGQLFVGGIPLNAFSIDSWRASCGCVQQEGYLFADTIAANIAISTEEPDFQRLREAAKTAQILDWIDNLPQGFETKVGDEGNGLSIGQKQRILIARAVYKDAKFLFLDEATNSLDANNEKMIMDYLHDFFNGRTVIIAAHRLSTIRNADCILVMDQGRIIEMGTHGQLMQRKGAYYRLFINQMAE